MMFITDECQPTLEERYFLKIRPQLYKLHASHYQYGVRKGTSLAEHLDSVCQFLLTITRIAGVPEEKREIILAVGVTHDLNKLDESGRSVKKLARDRAFLQEQLELAGVSALVKTEEDYELVRRLIERHSGHSASDGMRFFPEDGNIKKWAAMLIGADLFDLGIGEEKRLRKVENELTIALGRPCQLFRVCLSEDKGYLTSLLLGACEEVLMKYSLQSLAIYPDGQLFLGEKFPDRDLTKEIAIAWQNRIDRVFGNNIEQLVHPTKDGIKIELQAIQQNPEETLDCVIALLEKKKAGIKSDKIQQDVSKYAGIAGEKAVREAEAVGLLPIATADDFAISEGLKAAYLSYRGAGINPQEAWDRIGERTGLSKEQRIALEPFNSQYGRCLFAAKSAERGMEGIQEALRESFQLRLATNLQDSDLEVSEEMIAVVSQWLNFPNARTWRAKDELDAYIEANPRQRSSLGSTSKQIEELMSNNMPPETKVQSFSNRLPGGMSAEPKRQADTMASLAYKLMAVGASFPAATKQEPLYLHFALPKGSSPDLLSFWRRFLEEKAAIGEGGTVTIDELKFYKVDNEQLIYKPRSINELGIEFKLNKVVGLAFPKRPEFIQSTVIIPILWGDANNSIALLKTIHLALDLSLATDFGFPFVVSSNLEVESWNNFYGRVEGIPSTLQPLLGNGQYRRSGHSTPKTLRPEEIAEEILTRLRCLGKLAITIASLQKKDDCLYDLSRSLRRPIELYYVILRWLLREHDDPNLEYFWHQISQPLNILLESCMKDEHDLLSRYLKEAASIAEEAVLRGSSFRRTSQAEPFTEFINAIRSRKAHLSWDVVFGALVQNYHNRLDRIREHGVGATKYEQIKRYYEVLRQLFEEVYQSRPERLLADKKTLEAAYLFFLQEARQRIKEESKNQPPTAAETNEQ